VFICIVELSFDTKLKNEPNIQNILNKVGEKDDEVAFKQLFDLYSDGLMRFSYSILNNKELAEETVSDVFFKMWQHRKNLPRIENFKAYIFTSTRNIALNYLDKEKRERVMSLEDIRVPLLLDEICPETELIDKELKEAIGRAIDHLPERCKLIYSLAKIEQLRYKEIAQILDISVKTIDHQLTIAIKKIGDEIGRYLGDRNSSDKYSVLLHLFLPAKK
jgi:RNA polymerase sigma-70 factor (ECF subfamily)